MHVLICAVGSAGDVYPFIAISQALLERGHEVQMQTSSRFRAPVERAGIGFVPFGSTADYERLVQLPDLWHPRRGLQIILRELLDRLAESTAALEQLVRPKETVLIGSTLAWNVRLVQERLGVPGATVHLSPSCLASATLPPVLPGVGDLSWLPGWAVRLLQSISERVLIDPDIAPALNRVRAELGLQPVRRVLSRWMHSPELVICAWPEWFAPTQPDWPDQAVTTGFALLREAQPSRLDPALADFLEAGPIPIGLTPGSAMAHGKLFFARGLEACATLGRRAVLVTPYADQLPSPLPDWAHHAAYAPFDALLPRLATLVHHGGIGTCAEALAAGVPQIVVPFAHDQFDNAARLERLGLGVTLKAVSPASRWVRAFAQAQTGEAAAMAAVAAERMNHTTQSVQQIADRIERLGTRP
ncbi:MAG: glycosyltransferase [Methylibium sp.]|uniref:glycosyltransferase n=1 Tax=Methylibium sp. TaxID=2067992 RepID=UPI001810C2A8|nr:nucleotide disphospho-sugar-binding domain-containing protein [Methylibium sp.]MBA3598694.1 glycosyltransferase [Methylibium sp.]